MMELLQTIINSIINGYHVVIDAVYAFLQDLQLPHILYLVSQVLFTVFLLTVLVNIVMTLISPKNYGADHRMVVRKIGRKTYWFALLFQFIVWCLAPAALLAMVKKFNFVICAIIGILMLAGYILALLTMLFSRNGKRSYIAAALSKLSSSLILLALWLLLYTWLLF